MRALAVGLLLATRAARAGTLSLGAFVGAPGEGSGVPIGASQVPTGVLGRYALDDKRAITAGVGVPIASVGASAWGGFELRLRPFQACPWLMLYVAPGMRTGFVGPGYYARHSDVFVGFGYIYSGPWTVAPRLPVGVVARAGRYEMFAEGLAEVPVLPSPELLVGVAVGVRITL